MSTIEQNIPEEFEEILGEETGFEIPQGADPFEYLPDDALCRLMGDITNLKDILQYTASSPRFAALAGRCVIGLNSVTKVGVNIENITAFHNLQSLGDNIILIVKPETYQLLAQLPQLRAANMLITNASDLLLPILTLLNVGRKIPNVNFRLSDIAVPRTVFFLQNNRFMILRGKSLTRAQLVSTIQQTFPNLSYFDMSLQGQLQLMNRKLRNFLLEGDFGLVNPTQPPSEDNPSLSIYLVPLANSRLIDVRTVNQLFQIYGHYHGLVKRTMITSPEGVTTPSQGFINSDELLRKTTRESIESWNAIEKREIKGIQPPIVPDILLPHNLKTLASLLTSPGEAKELADYDIPNPLLPVDYIRISELIEDTWTAYGDMARPVYGEKHLYRTDGSVFTVTT